jgi:transketolase
MMEGISSEAASLAAHLNLTNLCWIYDSNRVTVEGHTDIAFTEDVAARFLAYGWNVERVTDPNDLTLLERSYRDFLAATNKLTLSIVPADIGYGASHTQKAGPMLEPIGQDIGLLREGDSPCQKGQSFESRLLRCEVSTRRPGRRSSRATNAIPIWPHRSTEWPGVCPMASGAADFPATPGCQRGGLRKVLNSVAAVVPWLIGGSADLSPSTKTRLLFDMAGDFQEDGSLGNRRGRNMHFGIREHAMCALINGMTLTGLRAFGSGFLVFTDYARGSIRCRRDEPAGPVCLDERFDQRRRGRSHPSADRTDCLAASNPRNGRHPPIRRERNGRGLSFRPKQ